MMAVSACSVLVLSSLHVHAARFNSAWRCPLHPMAAQGAPASRSGRHAATAGSGAPAPVNSVPPFSLTLISFPCSCFSRWWCLCHFCYWGAAHVFCWGLTSTACTCTIVWSCGLVGSACPSGCRPRQPTVSTPPAGAKLPVPQAVLLRDNAQYMTDEGFGRLAVFSACPRSQTAAQHSGCYLDEGAVCKNRVDACSISCT